MIIIIFRIFGRPANGVAYIVVRTYFRYDDDQNAFLLFEKHKYRRAVLVRGTTSKFPKSISPRSHPGPKVITETTCSIHFRRFPSSYCVHAIYVPTPRTWWSSTTSASITRWFINIYIYIYICLHTYRVRNMSFEILRSARVPT